MLSTGGKAILIKHVRSAIPMNLLSICQPPKTVLRNLERYFGNYFWEQQEDYIQWPRKGKPNTLDFGGVWWISRNILSQIYYKGSKRVNHHSFGITGQEQDYAEKDQIGEKLVKKELKRKLMDNEARFTSPDRDRSRRN
nr:uncharacterized protein LOC117276772 [Nicotiana tomentosiformis]